MAGRILIADGVVTNRIWLKTRLAAAFYTVLQAASGDEALRLANGNAPDLVLLGSDLGADNGLDLCRRLRATPATSAIPILAILPDATRAARMEALRAGADGVLTRPIGEKVLLARLRSLMRRRDMVDELELCGGSAEALGFGEPAPAFAPRVHVRFVTPDARTGLHWCKALRGELGHSFTHVTTGDALRTGSGAESPDLFVLAPGGRDTQAGLRLLAELRARLATRNAAILTLLPGASDRAVIDALDRGADDVLSDPVDPVELALRMRPLLARKAIADQARASLRHGLRAAVADPLTGLFNRRYAMPHLARIADAARQSGRQFAVMLADLDHFKAINDRFGHGGGDTVLIEVARRLRAALGANDLLARIGGEEFLVVMPDTDLATAHETARRLCGEIGNRPISGPGLAQDVTVTVSIGLALGPGDHPNPETAASRSLALADKALYGAKAHGRNKVTLSRTAA